jgi:nucleotide-binding universal stress UspA family protein
MLCVTKFREVYTMKTILVLTDFSISADYAADYALALAQHIEANLLLCNIYQRPADENMPDRAAWPKQACEANSINDLGALLARLKTKLDKEPPSNNYKPEIEQCSVDGAIDQKLAGIMAKHQVLLAVISAHSRHNLDSIFEKNHAWDIIDNAGFPVMVIPYQTKFKPFRQIAFATGMHTTDIAVLESISAIAKYSQSEVLVTHVTDKPTAKHSLQHFFNAIPFKITYPKITYNDITGGSVVNVFKKQSVYIDLLVLVHQKRGFLQNLFGQNIIRKMAAHPRKPLLIFPHTQLIDLHHI